MTTDTKDLLTAGSLAKLLGVSDAKIKKAIVQLKLEPTAKKGCCNLYAPESLKKIQDVLK